MEKQAYTASNRSIYSWGAGQMGSSFIYTSFGLLMLIYNTGFGMSAILVSWAVTLPRFVDCIVDPLIAHWSDNSRSRWGRRKPVLLASTFACAFFMMAVWWAGSTWSPLMQFIYLFAMSTLLYCSMGGYWMSHLALGYELTDDYHERTRVMAVKGLFANIAGLLTGWVYWLALRPVFGGEINGIRWISAGLALIAVACGLITVFNTKERFQTINREHIKILPAMRATLSNRPFVILLLMQITQNLGGTVFWGLYFYVNVYYVCQGDKSLATQIGGIMGTVGTILGFAIFPLITPISRRVGKRIGVMAGAGMIAFAALMAPFFLTPAFPYLQVIVWCALGPILATAQTLTSAIFPDICDLDELETGQRREGLFSAVGGFISKIEMSSCGLLVGYLVAWSGFDPKVSTQTADVLIRIRWFAFAPYIVFSLAAMYFAWRFPITETMMAEVRRKLDARRVAAHQAPADQPPPTDDLGAEPVLGPMPVVLSTEEVKKTWPSQ